MTLNLKTSTANIEHSIKLASGTVIPSYDLRYETYGKLNQDKSNAILICHALSGNHHAAGKYDDEDKHGWWNNMIGPGKPIDTDSLYVVCLNNIGGCHGSTGPNTKDKKTGKYFGMNFPIVTVSDWVNTQKSLMDYLKIPKWNFVIGGSLGGMQAMQWAFQFPTFVDNCIIIAAAPKLTAQNIAFNEVARQAIMKDPNWCGGDYLNQNKLPDKGLSLARMLGHITYLSDDSMKKKFGRDLRETELKFNYEVDFEIESYLRYQGEKFVSNFDANTYLLMTKSLDYFDPIKDFGDELKTRLAKNKSNFLVISFTSDWRFPPKRSKEIVELLLDHKKDVSYAEINSSGGHDAFLMENEDYFDVMKNFIVRSRCA